MENIKATIAKIFKIRFTQKKIRKDMDNWVFGTVLSVDWVFNS